MKKAILAIVASIFISGIVQAEEYLHGQSGTSYRNIGGTTYGSDGTSYRGIGNTIYGSDGSSSRRIGNSTYNSDGSSSRQIGNTLYNSDGSTVRRSAQLRRVLQPLPPSLAFGVSFTHGVRSRSIHHNGVHFCVGTFQQKAERRGTGNGAFCCR